MVTFPATIEYHDANIPEWMTIIKEDMTADFTLKITLESYDRIKIEEVNVEGMLIDLPKAFEDTGLTVADVNAIIAFIRFSAPRITVILSGTGTDIIEVVLPPGVQVYRIINAATGELVPFNFNEARNSFITVVRFSSEVELHVILSNVSNILGQAVNMILSILLTMWVIRLIIQFIYGLPQEVKV